MLQPTEALEAILARIPGPLGAEHVPLSEALGRSLASAVASDVDMPPFEKSAMDGYAVRSSDFAGGAFEEPSATEERELPCVGESRAGAPFEGAVPPFSCVAIYTGARVPKECDAVVMVEHTRHEGRRVFFRGLPRSGLNVSHKAEVMAVGRTVFEPRRWLSAVDLSVLAAVGCDPVSVHQRPVVSILTTGDELVEVKQRPGAGQIREGNTFYLRAACEQLGCAILDRGIVRDDAAALELAFRRALTEGDVLVTTGGVSMGRYDLVGPALEAVGVERVLHKVAIKPGKPIWFGMAGQKPVFGLPGNPVSALLGFEAFVRPALARLRGAPVEEERERFRVARWLGEDRTAKDRQINLPVQVRQGRDGVEEAEPLPWKGSADIVALTGADGLALVPPEQTIQKGALCLYRPLAL
ncbi:MAG: gephyrin-like molybdotransferase Glp [Planctomycetota bacterium]